MDNQRLSSASLKEQNAYSLLHSSIIKGNRSTLLEAIKLGCDLNSLSKFGDPPLVAAAGVDPYTTHDSKTGKDKMLDIFETLVKHGQCDINSRGGSGETALQRSLVVRAQNRVKYLLENGCDVDIRDSRGQTALFHALSFPEGLEILLRYEPLLDVYDSEGFTPLMIAMMSESPQSTSIMKMLLQAGSSVNALSAKSKMSALMVSLREDGSLPRSDQRVEKSYLLIAHGIDVNIRDKQGLSSLHHAVKSQCVSLVDLLLKNKASVELKDNAGLSVIDYGKKYSNSEIIRMIERTADKSARLIPYEESLLSLESLYTAIINDHDLPAERRDQIKALIDTLETSLQGVISDGRGSESMSVEHKRNLKEKHNELCEEIMPLYILPYLQKENILTKEDTDMIASCRARKLMCVKLLEILPHRGSKAYSGFLNALKASKQYHICDILEVKDVKL